MKRMKINPFSKNYSEKDKELLEFLSGIKIFEGLSYSELYSFIPDMYERKYIRNEVVFFRGDLSMALYLIRGGIVSLTLDYEDSVEELTTVLPNMALGESCMLPETKRLLNAVVVSEEASMYVIPQINVFEIFERNVKIKARIMQNMSTIYHDYNTKLFEAYRNSLGFFHLPLVYKSIEDNIE